MITILRKWLDYIFGDILKIGYRIINYKNMEQNIIVTIGAWQFITGLVTMSVMIILTAWRGGHKIGSIENSIDWIKDEIGRMWGRLEKVEGTDSPLNPTERGLKKIKDSGLAEIVDKTYKEWLLERLKKLLPKDHTKYDVQTVARRLMISLKDKPMMRSVEKYAFDNGVEIELILRLGGLWLRDNFLKVPHKIAKKSEE